MRPTLFENSRRQRETYVAVPPRNNDPLPRRRDPLPQESARATCRGRHSNSSKENNMTIEEQLRALPKSKADPNMLPSAAEILSEKLSGLSPADPAEILAELE